MWLFCVEIKLVMVCLQKLKWCGFENLCGSVWKSNWLWFVYRNLSGVVVLCGNQTGYGLSTET